MRPWSRTLRNAHFRSSSDPCVEIKVKAPDRSCTVLSHHVRFGEWDWKTGWLVVHSTTYGSMKKQDSMLLWPRVRHVLTVLILLLAATEIFACDLAAVPNCLFSTQSAGDSDEGCSGDECLCCCAHIVVVAPTVPLASLGFISQAVPVENVQAPDFPPSGIEHPPRF